MALSFIVAGWNGLLDSGIRMLSHLRVCDELPVLSAASDLLGVGVFSHPGTVAEVPIPDREGDAADVTVSAVTVRRKFDPAGRDILDVRTEPKDLSLFDALGLLQYGIQATSSGEFQQA